MAFGLRTGVGVAGAFCLMALVAAGCGGGGNSGFESGRSADNPLVGTWQVSGLSVPGRSISCPNTLTENGVVVDFCVNNETIKFNNDGTYVLTFPAPRYTLLYQETGSYSYSGGTLRLTRNSKGYDTNSDNVVSPTEQTPINPGQTLVGSLTFTGPTTFVLEPQVSASSTYTVPMALDNTTPVTETYTKIL